MEQAGAARRNPLVRVIILFSAAMLLLNVGIIAKRAYVSYADSMQAGEDVAERLAHTMADHIRLTFLGVDLVLKRAIERQYFNALFGNTLNQDISHNLYNWTVDTPQIAAMLMTNEHGVVTAMARKPAFQTWLEGSNDVLGRDFYQAQQENPDADYLHVGWQNSWIPDQSGFVVMSRRISKLDGSFGGIIAAAVTSDYILNFFRAVQACLPHPWRILKCR